MPIESAASSPQPDQVGVSPGYVTEPVPREGSEDVELACDLGLVAREGEVAPGLDVAGDRVEIGGFGPRQS
jgi:hypothetical protein